MSILSLAQNLVYIRMSAMNAPKKDGHLTINSELARNGAQRSAKKRDVACSTIFICTCNTHRYQQLICSSFQRSYVLWAKVRSAWVWPSSHARCHKTRDLLWPLLATYRDCQIGLATSCRRTKGSYMFCPALRALG